MDHKKNKIKKEKEGPGKKAEEDHSPKRPNRASTAVQSEVRPETERL